jgi:hypothetical protein
MHIRLDMNIALMYGSFVVVCINRVDELLRLANIVTHFLTLLLSSLSFSLSILLYTLFYSNLFSRTLGLGKTLTDVRVSSGTTKQ